MLSDHQSVGCTVGYQGRETICSWMTGLVESSRRAATEPLSSSTTSSKPLLISSAAAMGSERAKAPNDAFHRTEAYLPAGELVVRRTSCA